MYRAEALVNGFPGKAATHGSFGWSSVWLLRSDDRTVMVETGPPSYLPLLTAALAERGIAPDEVTDVLITHAHWDHLGNVSLFPNARRWIARAELRWAEAQQPDEPFVSGPLLGAVTSPGGLLQLVDDGEHELFPGVRAHHVAGHTPGHLAFEVETDRGPILFVGDAAKNVHELEHLVNDSALDRDRGSHSLAWIRDAAVAGDMTVVPGHDVACRWVDGHWRREAEQTTTLEFFAGWESGPARIVISDATPRWVTVDPDG